MERYVVQFWENKMVVATEIYNAVELLHLIDVSRDAEADKVKKFVVYKLGEEVLDWS